MPEQHRRSRRTHRMLEIPLITCIEYNYCSSKLNTNFSHASNIENSLLSEQNKYMCVCVCESKFNSLMTNEGESKKESPNS